MIIKGRYRDTFYREGEHPEITPWKPNAIVPDFGYFLALLMKKDYTSPMGVDFIALGSGSEDWQEFKQRVVLYFNSKKFPKPLDKGTFWAWAKDIKPGNIHYIDSNGNQSKTVTDRLRIEVTFKENEPPTKVTKVTKVYTIEEFALLGIKGKKSYSDKDIFFIDYVKHGPVKKNNKIELSRSVELIFPAETK